MRLTEVYEVVCSCGARHVLGSDQVEFYCECGRISIVDWARKFVAEELPITEAEEITA